MRFGVPSKAQPSGGRPEAASEATTGCPADPHQSVASAGESSHGGAGPARAPAACSAGPSDAALPLLVRTGRTLATWTPAACQLEKPREAARGEVLGRRSTRFLRASQRCATELQVVGERRRGAGRSGRLSKLLAAELQRLGLGHAAAGVRGHGCGRIDAWAAVWQVRGRAGWVADSTPNRAVN